MQERIRPTKSGLFSIELLLCVGVFVFCAAVCTGIFVRAEMMSRQSAELNTADRERRLTEQTAQRAAAYYAAECAVMERLSATSGDTVTLTEPVGDSLSLVVEAVRRDGRWTILRWQTVYSGTWEPDEFMELWGGDA